MHKLIFLLSLLTLSSCLGPIRGESTDTSGSNQTFIEDPNKAATVDWSHKAGQVVQGSFELKAHINSHGHKIMSSRLMLNDRVLTTGGEGQLELAYTLDSARDRLAEGVLKVKLVVNDDEVHETTLLLNNHVFSEKAFWARSLGETKSNATTWLQSKVEKIADINRDGEEDILILDDAKAYVRLSHPDLAQNYQRIWEIADGSWDSATACDVNGDGFTDIVLGSSFERGKIQVFFGPMMGSKQFFDVKVYLGNEKREALPKYFPNTNILNPNTESISYDGIGLRLSCIDSDKITGDEIFSTSAVSGRMVPSESVVTRVPGYSNTLSVLTYNNSFHLTNLTNSEQLKSNILGNNTTPRVTHYTSLSKKADYNSDNFEDIFVSNIGNDGKFYSVFLFGGEYISRSDYFLINEFTRTNGLAGSLVPINTFSLSDINKDGFDDAAIGLLSLGLEPEGFKTVGIKSYVPHAIIYFGGKKFPDKTLTLMHPTNGSKKSRFGESVVSGDYNGDGFVDLAISAPGYDAVEHPTGEVIVFYGPGFSKYDIWTTPQGPERWFGQRMLALDYNRDGRDDIMASVFGTWGSSGFGNFELLFDN